MSSFVSALDAEIAELQADIEARPDPRHIKLQELHRLRALYVPQREPVSVEVPANRSPEPEGVRPFGQTEAQYDLVPFGKGTNRRMIRIRRSGRQRSPEREAAINNAREYLAEHRSKWPIRTSEIHEYLAGLGIAVPGTDPVNNLSAMLSNSSEFRSEGRRGWTLATEEAA